MEFEKCILMIALMAGVMEDVIWNLVLVDGLANGHQEMPDRIDKDAWVKQNQEMAEIWHDLNEDQQTVFKDPYFFSLANLPDYSITSLPENSDVIDDENENGFDTSNFDTASIAPKVHQLSDNDKAKYKPIFNELVNVEKVHFCRVGTLQKRSLIAVCKAHHNFSVVCQQHQISYYLTTASCGGAKGWSQTFSNNVKFAEWASKTPKIPTKFAAYVHGKEVSKEIEGKVPQPSDQRKSVLCDVHMPGRPFPKGKDRVGYIKNKNWSTQIVCKSGSLLKEDNILPGHWNITNAIVRLWSKDIENGLFLIKANVIDANAQDIQETQ
ncbi:hypothetical protein DFH28DRAFT_924624 [Melampsora americana]|nr:hypothetical protein DFH28DRAFT_924624 [Melampsora americana]